MPIRKILVTGGAGFIGVNCVARFLGRGCEVGLLDNFSRKGTDLNLEWARRQPAADARLTVFHTDIRSAADVESVVNRFRPDAILHLAAQAAVTTSVTDPRMDLETNILGTFHVLEAVRKHAPEALLLYSSTNKVYGHLDHQPIREGERRYEFVGTAAISESAALDFYSPYGCSKGAADQYVLDYGRIYSLNTATFRQSCIYGPRQFGVEDQGWVAWLMIAHEFGKPMSIFGNGKQVRDILHIEDLMDCYELALQKLPGIPERAFNVGGGPANSMSLLEFMEWLERASGRKVKYSLADWRPGDQPIYVSDNSRALRLLGWTPRISMNDGLETLYRWIKENREFLGIL